MEEIKKNLEKIKISYYRIFPTKEESLEDIKKNRKNLVGIIFTENKNELTEKNMENVSKSIQDVVLLYTHISETPFYDYDLYFYFNGIRIKFFSYGVFAFLRYLYDSKIIRNTLRLKIGNLELKTSTRPDKNLNFFIKYKKPLINELDVPIFDILGCLGLKSENITANNKIYEIRSPFVNLITIPLISQKSLENIKYSMGSIVSLKRVFKNLPSIFAYYQLKEEMIIRSRFLNTSSIIMEFPSSPLACTLLHYFLMKIYNQFEYDELIHYQGRNIESSNRLITRVEVGVSNDYNLVCGGKCLPVKFD